MTTGDKQTVAIIVGAGPAGLSTAASLHKLSIPYIILEREDCIASLFNKKAYDRLHLHLAKQFTHLPHFPIPATFPTYISRSDFLKYLDQYAAHFNITPEFRNNVKFAKYDEDMKKWKVEAAVEDGGVRCYVGRFLVVATGENCDAFVPEVDGLSEFEGEVIHSTEYKSGKEYEKKKVLVVGAGNSGNSGMEIAFDLANHGAITSIVVRSPAAKEARYDKESVMKFYRMLVRRRYYSDDLPTANPWSTIIQQLLQRSDDNLSDEDRIYSSTSQIGNVLPSLPAQRNLTPPPTLYPQQPVSTPENYNFPRFRPSELSSIRSKRTARRRLWR